MVSTTGVPICSVRAAHSTRSAVLGIRTSVIMRTRSDRRFWWGMGSLPGERRALIGARRVGESGVHQSESSCGGFRKPSRWGGVG